MGEIASRAIPKESYQVDDLNKVGAFPSTFLNQVRTSG